MKAVPKKSPPRKKPVKAEPVAISKQSGPRAAKSFPIVGIGASAGGLEAFTELLKHLPHDTGMGFVVVQHLDPKHDSALTQLLGRSASLPVHEVSNNLRIQPNQVYVIPPNTTLEVEGGVLKLLPRTQKRQPNHSIDQFFKSLSQDQREYAIGVVLSGTASDGTVGLEAIKAEGGITFAQDESARYDSMPRSAIAAGCVDLVLSPENIARELGRIATHPHVAGKATEFETLAEDDRASATEHEDDATPLPSGGRGTPRTDARRVHSEAAGGRPGKEKDRGAADGYKKILLLLRNHAGVDFSLYKSSTIQRRIARRMVLSKHNTLTGYAQFLRGNVKELDALYSDTLISVTSFFRNPETFDALRRKVLPKLVQQRSDEPVRVWVLGCSTGQEAYSIAMSFVEIAEKSPRARKLQVFATDLNEALLQKARHGLYSKNLAQDLSPERLRRFFVEELDGYRVIRPLREMVVFARQNLVGDPPFSRMDLISCRNLLIYFEPDLQKKVFPVFHYALKPGGFLCLGASESIGGFTELFEPVDKKHKIFVRKATAATHKRLPLVLGPGEKPASGPSASIRTGMRIAKAGAASPEKFPAELNAQREADRVAINQYAPPAVLINASLQILQFRGPTRAYLEPPTGKASFDVLKMARAGLMLPLRAAINKAKKDNKPARKENIRIEQDGKPRTVAVEVIPLKNLRERSFLVVFEDGEKALRTEGRLNSAPRATADRGARGQESRRVSGLETELADMSDYLQSMVEQYEAANEELQASNEEVQSANEELQSLNEELETSKEELESTNEELTTVNEEMASRNLELGRLNSDLTNIQTSAHQAIVLLGRDLSIRRFSVQAEKQFNLRPGDLGRPFSHVRHGINLPELEQFITEVIATVRAQGREVRDDRGHWHSLRVLPYLTTDNKVDGAVLELVDINDLKSSHDAIAAERDYADSIIESMRDPVVVLHADLRVDRANKAFYNAFDVSVAQSRDRLIYELGNGQWNIPRLRELLEEILPHRNVFDDFEVTHDFESIGQRTMLMNARRLTAGGERSARILLGIQDITDRKRAEDEAREGEERYRTLFALAPVAVYSCAADGVIDKFNQQAVKLWGREPGEGDSDERFCGALKMFRPDGSFMSRDQCPMAEVLRGMMQELRDAELVIERPDGSRITIVVNIRSLRNQRGEVAGAISCFYDITQRKEVELALHQSDRLKTEFLAILAHELRNPLAPIRNSLEIMRRITGGSPTSPGPQVLSATARASPPLSPPIDAIIATMERQIDHMVGLVDDLLDVSRIGSGKIALRKKMIELGSVVYQAIETARPGTEALGQAVLVTLPEDPIYLDADPTRLAQILGNLLNNASKFTAKGGHIWLTVETSEAGDGVSATGRPSTLVAIHVRDDGVGIHAEQLSRIFDMFVQVDSSLERSVGGLGIGLTLVKNLVELHGGTIEAHSGGLDQGSEFVVRLPTMQEAPKALPAEAPTADAATTARRILIVDDNRDAAESLAMLLQMSGHETRIAYDGLEAVEAATVFQPEVVLLDLGLPKLNGFEAARRIRKQRMDKRVTLVALTGWGQEEDRRRSHEAGFDAHMVKPVEYEALLTLLAKLASAEEGAGS